MYVCVLGCSAGCIKELNTDTQSEEKAGLFLFSLSLLLFFGTQGPNSTWYAVQSGAATFLYFLQVQKDGIVHLIIGNTGSVPLSVALPLPPILTLSFFFWSSTYSGHEALTPNALLLLLCCCCCCRCSVAMALGGVQVRAEDSPSSSLMSYRRLRAGWRTTRSLFFTQTHIYMQTCTLCDWWL